MSLYEGAYQSEEQAMAASVISTVMVSNVFTLTTTAGSTDDNGNVMAIMRDARVTREDVSRHSLRHKALLKIRHVGSVDGYSVDPQYCMLLANERRLAHVACGRSSANGWT